MNKQSSVYVTEQSSETISTRKLLLPFFKEVKRRKQKTVWKAENGRYSLYIDDIKVDLLTSPTDNDSMTSDLD